jgi:hypothetical protein
MIGDPIPKVLNEDLGCVKQFAAPRGSVPLKGNRGATRSQKQVLGVLVSTYFSDTTRQADTL